MQLYSIKKFIDLFIEYESPENPNSPWKVKNSEISTPTFTMKAIRSGSTTLFVFIIRKADSFELGRIIIPARNNRSGYLGRLTADLGLDFREKYKIPLAVNVSSTTKARGVIDYIMNYDKFMSLSTEKKEKAFIYRLQSEVWSILLQTMWEELNYNTVGIESRYYIYWNVQKYLTIFCTDTRIGVTGRERTPVPCYFRETSRDLGECLAIGALFYCPPLSCWEYPRMCVEHGGGIFPKEYVDSVPTVCSKCGEKQDTDSLYTGLCEKCLGISRKSLVIHPYQTRAETKLKFRASKKSHPKLQNGTVYLGIELEYESNNLDTSVLEVMRILEGHAILKHDGSLVQGFEIVSCPATRDIHSTAFEPFFEKLVTGQLELQGKSNCGFHIHISKKPLSQLTIGKLNVFMNNKENDTFLNSIAERTSSYSKQDFYRAHVCYPWNNKESLGHTERYNMLNLRNKNTLEFRMFAPPSTYEAFQKALDFVEALVEYSLPCNHFNSLEAHRNYEQFIKFLRDNRKSYPYLYGHLQKLLPEKFPKPKPRFIPKEEGKLCA